MIMLSIAENIGDKISISLLVALFSTILYSIIKACIKAGKDHKQLLEKLEQPYVEPQIFEYKAVVVKKYIARKNLGGIKMPKTKECCCVVFKTQDGKLWDEEVSFDEFLQLQENQSVIVGVADGEYCGFCTVEE